MEATPELILFSVKAIFSPSISSLLASNIGFFCSDIPSDFIWYLALLPWKSTGRRQQPSLEGD